MRPIRNLYRSFLDLRGMMPVRKAYRSLRDLRRQLKPHPGHFRGLILSFTGNVARLAASKLRRGLARTELVVIGLPERMGDIVACEPASRRVRDLHPDDRVLWAARPSYLDLVKGNPHLDGVLKIHCLTEWIWLRKLGLFDRVYDFNVDKRRCDACLQELSKGKFGENTEIDVFNYYDYGGLLATFSRSAGIPMDDGDPSLYIDRGVEREVDLMALPGRYITIHTKSEEGYRDWDDRKWASLIDHITGVYHVGVVEIGRRSGLVDYENSNYIDMCGKISMIESAEIIRRSFLFIGIDSGPSHLANAVRTRGIILLGKLGNFVDYLPYSGFYSDSRNCCIIRHDGIVAEISLDSCLSALAEMARSIRELPDHDLSIMDNL